MKNIYSKLKKINKQIAEAEIEINNINESSSPYYAKGEKAYELEKLNHWLGELQESKHKVLLQLVDAANLEIQTLKGNAKAA